MHRFIKMDKKESKKCPSLSAGLLDIGLNLAIYQNLNWSFANTRFPILVSIFILFLYIEHTKY